MVRNLLVRGMLAGLAAAALALVFAWVFGEPQVTGAIAVEESGGGHATHAPAVPGTDSGTGSGETTGHDHEDEGPVSRDVQSPLGLATGLGVFGVAVGGLFALAFAFAYGRVGALGARATSALLALGAFVAVELLPFLKYPANPPAVGDPATISRRTVLYLAMLAISVLLAVAAVHLGRRLAARHGAWNATLLAVAAYLAAVIVAYLLMPTVDEVPSGFPATLLWRFRLASLGIQAIMWSGIGLTFGVLAERALAPRRALATAA
ncbi:membrane protein [Sphaerisporangium siamense]|uniref:Putative cobalt transporter CbtA n=1 Tax=Sphaerisporangium siamense TaxID=795645 RepID=A0A7W7GAH6_9ACTN|nr:CbtA family protein [Sphaerisporangium siamense]MBB4701770.1 putative cobalt transporter CbtA [Sphaerisporangium siamense]GII84325.1 membrane protein [Sphaerisporangium siamense]